MTALLLDSREPRARIAAVQQALAAARQPASTLDMLPAGDYAFPYEVGWEVKTIGSLLASVTRGASDGRSTLESELEALATVYASPRLVVIGLAWATKDGELHSSSGDGASFNHRWLYASYLGILTSAADRGIATLQVDSEAAFAHLVASTYKRYAEGGKPREIKRKAIFAFKAAEEAPLRILAALPGVNSVLARRLWEAAGDVRTAVAILSSDGAGFEVQGMGGVRKAAVRQALNQQWQAEEKPAQ